MRIIIAGSRQFTDIKLIDEAVQKSGFEVTEVVSGGARGVDSLGEQWARSKGLPTKRFIPDWRQGNLAALHRNGEMAAYAEALVAVWDGRSRGTQNMIYQAEARKLPVFVLYREP
jgi:hypothetical protein